MLIVFGGLPGVGKTTLASRVAARTCATFLRLDAVEAGLVLAGLVPDQASMGPKGYLVAQSLAGSCLRANLPVVVDAVNPVASARAGWAELAEQLGSALLFVEVTCSDLEQHRARVEARRPDLPGLVVPSWQQVLDREYEPWPPPRLLVDNRGNPERHVQAILDAMPR